MGFISFNITVLVQNVDDQVFSETLFWISSEQIVIQPQLTYVHPLKDDRCGVQVCKIITDGFVKDQALSRWAMSVGESLSDDALLKPITALFDTVERNQKVRKVGAFWIASSCGL